MSLQVSVHLQVVLDTVLIVQIDLFRRGESLDLKVLGGKQNQFHQLVDDERISITFCRECLIEIVDKRYNKGEHR